MHPSAMVLTLGVLWALLHFWLLPLARDRWQASDLRVKIARAGSLVALEKLRDLAAMGVVAVSVVLALVLIGNWLGGTGALWPRLIVQAIASVYETAKGIAEGYASVLMALGVIGAAIVLWRSSLSAKKRVIKVWMQKAEEEFAAIYADPSRIDIARQDPELLPLVQDIDMCAAEIETQEGKEQRDETAVTQAQQALSQALSRLAIESTRKHIDFPAVAGQASATETAPRSGALSRIFNVLSSKRLSTDLGLVRKPMGWVVSGLLFVSLIGWSAAPLANSLQLAVNNLRMELAHHDAQRNLDGVLSHAPEPKTQSLTTVAPSPAAAQAASRLVAQIVIRELAQSSMLDSAGGVRRTADAHAEFVRGVLSGQQMSAPGDDVAKMLRVETAETVSIRPLNVDSSAARHLTEEIRPSLERLQTKDPERFAALVARLEARYSTPMTPLDAQAKLTAKILDDVFANVDVKPEGELAKQAQKLAKDFGKEAVKTWADTNLKEFLSDALSATARPEVRRGFTFEASEETRDLIAALQAREGNGWQSAPAGRREAEMSQLVARKVADSHGDINPAERHALAERMGGYERIFPLEEGPRAPPPDVIPSGGGGGGGGGGGTPHEGRPSPSGSPRGQPHFAQARATSFRLASLSFRVRGVLVGQDLAGSALDVTDIRWNLVPPTQASQPTRVAIDLRVADSANSVAAWRSAGVFDAGVLNQGLRYAADRRVIATTITPGDGKEIRRLTYLHPVLADTPLGCRVVEIDRVVDTFTMAQSSDTGAAAIAEISSDREQMYGYLAVLELAEAVASTGGVCPMADVQRVIAKRQLVPVRFSPGLTQALDRFTAEQAAAAPGSEGLLVKAGKCASGPTEKMAQCLCEQVQPGGLPARYWFPEDHTSQVRERSANLTNDLAWLRPSVDRTGHLDFWIHTTFSLRNGQSGEADESRTSALNFTPDQLEKLRLQVSQRLPQYATGQLRATNYDEFMRPLEQFVLAQRLARTALAGRLGPDFPLVKLIELEKATRSFVPQQTTIRWEPVNSAMKLMDVLNSADPHAAELYRSYELGMFDRASSKKQVCDAASR